MNLAFLRAKPSFNVYLCHSPPFALPSAMSFHMPLPYGPAPSPDKPVAKAHPSFQGVHSLVISSGWRWRKQGTQKKEPGWQPTEFRQIIHVLFWSSHHFAVWYFPTFFCNMIVMTYFTNREVKYSFDFSAEGEWNHNTSCPGGGDTGMQSSQSTGRRHSSGWWSREQHFTWNQNYNVRDNNRKNTNNNNNNSNEINNERSKRLSRNITIVNGLRKFITLIRHKNKQRP